MHKHQSKIKYFSCKKFFNKDKKIRQKKGNHYNQEEKKQKKRDYKYGKKEKRKKHQKILLLLQYIMSSKMIKLE